MSNSTPVFQIEKAREEAILRQIESDDAQVDPATGFLRETNTTAKGYHSNLGIGAVVRPTRSAMNRAAFLLASPQPQHHAAGNRVLANVLQLQDKNPASPTFGIWSWFAEEPLDQMCPPDYNWADFLGSTIALILQDHRNRLTPEVLREAEASLERACRAIIKRNVAPDYTNIAIMGSTVTAAAGTLLSNPEFLDFGRARIERSGVHYRENGGFNEYNSPTYTMVAVNELERMLHLVADERCRTVARQLLDEVWKTIALHYHAPTAQWAGPHSRAYSDLLADTMCSAILARAGLAPAESLAEASPLVPALPVPAYLCKHFEDHFATPALRQDSFVVERPHFHVTGTTWLTSRAALGSASYHTFWEQARGLLGYWTQPESAEEPAVLRMRFLHDGKDFSSAWGRNLQEKNAVLSAIGLLTDRGSVHPYFDRPEDVTFRARSFRCEWQLAGRDATATQLDTSRFELSAGGLRVVVHVAVNCVFDGNPVVWSVEQGKNCAAVVGTCYDGPEKDFPFKSLGPVRIAVGIELLEEDVNPSTEPVVIAESDWEAPQEGPYYEVCWPRIGSGKKLLAPCQPTEQ